MGNYLRLRNTDNFVGRQYLNGVLLRYKFELSMIPALVSFLIGVTWLEIQNHSFSWTAFAVLVIFVLSLVVYLFKEAKDSAGVLDAARVYIVEASSSGARISQSANVVASSEKSLPIGNCDANAEITRSKINSGGSPTEPPQISGDREERKGLGDLREKEYETLRAEILEWQTRRFTLATGSLVIVFAILGWAVTAPDKWSWPVVSSLVLIVLALAGYMSLLMGLLNSRLSTYIEVFHEDCSTGVGWERRHRKPRKDYILSSKGGYAALYFIVGLMSFVIGFTVCSRPATEPAYILFAISIVLFLTTLALLILKSHPSRRYIKQWQDIRNEETGVTDET